ARSRARPDDPHRPACGRDAAPRRGRSSATLDLAPPRPLDALALWAEVLSRDGPNGPTRPQAVVEESQEAAGTGRSRAATSVHRAAPERAGARPRRPAFGGLSRRGAHPPGCGSRLRLGRAWPAVLDRLKLAAPVGAGLVLWGVSPQRGAGAAVALSA